VRWRAGGASRATSRHRVHASAPVGGTGARSSADAHWPGEIRLRRRALSLVEHLFPRRSRSASLDTRSHRLSDGSLRLFRDARCPTRSDALVVLIHGSTPHARRSPRDVARSSHCAARSSITGCPMRQARGWVASLQNAIPYSAMRIRSSPRSIAPIGPHDALIAVSLVSCCAVPSSRRAVASSHFANASSHRVLASPHRDNASLACERRSRTPPLVRSYN
jgi:hypothetical protein